MTRATIRTPRGKRMTPQQYVALHYAQMARSIGGWGNICNNGHPDCACWESGPCTDELLSEIESNAPASPTCTEDYP